MNKIKIKISSIRSTIATTLGKAVILFGPGDWVITIAVALLATGLGMVYLPLPLIILPSVFLGFEVWKKMRKA